MLGGPTSTSQIEASTDSVALFAQADYALTDNLKLTAGLRYVEDDKDFELDFQRRTPIPLGPLTDRVQLANTFDEWTPRFGIDYNVDTTAFDSLLLYASAARGFKSGGFNGINITNANVARAPYGPETNWTYEVGAKMDLLDRTLRINAAAFQANIDDLALNATVEVLPGVFDFPVQNAGKATVQGLELESTWIATNNLTVFLNASFLDGKYDSLNPTSAPAVAQLPRVPGNNNRLGVKAEPPQLPTYTFTVGFDYSLPTSFGSFDIGSEWYRTDDYITSATNDFVVKAYDRFNGYIGVGIGEQWDVRLLARNIADERQVFVGSRGLGGFLLLPPRELLLTFSYKL
ncbi:MAG: TonB-dependent receptor [Steroidobacteraceae bacterium]|nr:TonB-dependent receptor [Steroidobacteraceae bacterium]